MAAILVGRAAPVLCQVCAHAALLEAQARADAGSPYVEPEPEPNALPPEAWENWKPLLGSADLGEPLARTVRR